MPFFTFCLMITLESTIALCILYDGGGFNSASHHIFKQELLKLSKSLELDIIIAHHPPYCSKYNPIEHKLFAHITKS